MLAVLCALGSSLMYALASVLQQHGAAGQPEDQSLKLGLLVLLFRQPAWLLGLTCDVSGYVLQFVALGHGPIVVVQPLLVCGLLFALPIGAAWAGRRLRALDWVAAVMVCAGLGVFLAVADPGAGRNNASLPVWTILLLGVSAVAAALVVVGRRSERRLRAVALSAAAGVVYGAAAALTKTSSHLLDHGIVPLFSHWQPYVLAVFGIGGMLLAQSAFQAGDLDASLPMMSVGDPVVSIAIGALMFRETISSGVAALTVETVFLLIMFVGVVLLARSEAGASRAADRLAAAGR